MGCVRSSACTCVFSSTLRTIALSGGMGAYEHADCNDNGIPDDQDINDGTSGDCNNNIRPDECESAEDCNLNGVQDICDLAEGTSKEDRLGEP